ncbi:hypothetical protein SAMN05216205_0503 [Pseudomonas mohnii]|uniref:Uncharacterized protein n=1 Tax=Pseudomonas mohnii TaxID=395600 RepID=A0ABY0XN96_9PSED|nr:hypothetical protein [Pseudomonas mohnii]SEB74053.1 hypothetical protein SAMN05216205_0503 [Pseudomonas mohnii]
MTQESYYAKTAYGSTEVPEQEPSNERPWIMRFAKVRLPWGNADEVTPVSFVEEYSPRDLRNQEHSKIEREEQIAKGSYTPSPFEHIDFHMRDNHESFRYALLPVSSHFWIYMVGVGRILFLIFLTLSFFILTAEFIDTKKILSDIIADYSVTLVVLLGLPLLCWMAGAVVIKFFQNLWIKPSRGPIWELNRRTGLVTVFDYKNNGEYKKNGTIGELTAPFYEFDAYIATSPDSQGMPLNVLYLAHRYRNIMINFGALLCPGPDVQPPCALWDFIQNYMNVSRPLPDLPQYEEYRHLDPTTAEYDRLTGRNPRYWIDMDDATFKQIVSEMHQRVDEIDTFERPNLMAGYVTYVD